MTHTDQLIRIRYTNYITHTDHTIRMKPQQTKLQQQPLMESKKLTSTVEEQNEAAGPQCRQGKQPMAAPPKKNQQEDEGAEAWSQMKKMNAQGGRVKATYER